MEINVANIENNISSGIEPSLNEVFDDLLLGVNGDCPAAGQAGKINPVATTIKP
jgi:hypothetical protein